VRPGRPIVAILAFLLAPVARGRDFYAAPDGTRAGAGSRTSPWDLQTALGQPPPVRPGDTIWLRGGRYVGTFRSSLTGTAAAPITVREVPGERAILDGHATTTLASPMDEASPKCPLAAALYAPNTVVRIDSEEIYLYGAARAVNRGWNGTRKAPHAAGAKVVTNTVTLAVDGAYTWFMGFEITNTSGARSNATAGSLPPDGLGFAVDVNGPGTKIVNMVIHDAGQGIGLWTSATDAEAYGNVVYYNGWDASDRGHGHGIYAQNQAPGVKRIVDNVLYGQFAIGVQAYTGGGSIDDIQLEGNVAFDNGVLSRVSGYTYNLLVGGLRLAKRPSLVSNFTYSPAERGGNVGLGYKGGCSDAVVKGNVFAGRNALQVVSCLDGLAMAGNTFHGATAGFAPSSFPDNAYGTARPRANEVYVRPNRYEKGRAHVVVYDWTRDASVGVDPSGVLAPGDAFEVRSVRNLFGPPVLAGTYKGGSLSIPMRREAPASPVGAAAPAPADPEFAVFLLLRTASSPSPAPAKGRVQARARGESTFSAGSAPRSATRASVRARTATSLLHVRRAR
jgi:hypothetical protein